MTNVSTPWYTGTQAPATAEVMKFTVLVEPFMLFITTCV